MSNFRAQKKPKTQPVSAGSPPRPPKKTARGAEDDSPEDKHIDIPDPVILKQLAGSLHQRPFRIVADIMELGRLVFARDPIDFETASKVAKKYGFLARKVA